MNIIVINKSACFVAMGVIDKLKFWKKDDFDDFQLPETPSSPPPADPLAGQPAMEQPPNLQQLGMPEQGFQQPDFRQPEQDFQQQSDQPFIPKSFQEKQQFSQPPAGNDQMALISSKLDTIKAQLDTVLHRLDRLEERPYQQRWRST